MSLIPLPGGLAGQLSGASSDAGLIPVPALAVLPCVKKHVAPVLTVSANQLLRETDGSTPNEIAVTLEVTADHPEISYNGNLRLRRGHRRVQVFAAGRVAGFGDADDELVIPVNDLSVTTSLALTASGIEDGACLLTLSLDDPHLLQIEVGPPDTENLLVESINEVTPTLTIAAPTLWHDASGVQQQIITATLRVTQSNPAIPYPGTAELSRSAGGASLHALAAATDGDGFQGHHAVNLPIAELLAAPQDVYLRALAVGALTLTLTLTDPHDPRIRVLGPATHVLPVLPLNTVTPHLDVEYKVLPLARDLAQHQAFGEAHHTTDLVSAEVWITQDQIAIGYTGVLRVTRDQGRVLAYPNADGSGAEMFGGNDHFDVDNAAIANGQHFPFYLRGSLAGAFRLSVAAQQMGLPDVHENDGNTIDMATVSLALELHRDLAAPVPGAMPDDYKVATGRILHVQNPITPHGRARLEIPAPSADVWHVGDANYEVLISVEATSGGVAIFDDPQAGALQPLPIRLIENDFQLGAKVLWVQGSATTVGWREIKIDIGLNRPNGGMPCTPKRHADWARLTVVEITQVTPAADARQLINIPAAPGSPEFGRAYHTTATLTPALQNVVVMLRLVPDPTNKALLPAAQAHQDHAVPIAANTNMLGAAEADLTLSRYGGDLFQVGAFLEEDGTAGNAAPVLSHTLTVWRKIFYQLFSMARTAGGDFSNRIDEVSFQHEFTLGFVEVERAGAVTPLVNDRAVLFAQGGVWAPGAMPGPFPPRTVALGFIDSILDGPITDNVQLAGIPGAAVHPVMSAPGDFFDLTHQHTWLSGAFNPRYRTAAALIGPAQARAPGLAAFVNQPNSCQIAVNFSMEAGNVDFELVVSVIDVITGVARNETWAQNNMAPAQHQSPVLNGCRIDPLHWFVSLQVRTSAVGFLPPGPVHAGAPGQAFFVNQPGSCQFAVDLSAEAGNMDFELVVRVIDIITGVARNETWTLNNMAAAQHQSPVLNGDRIDPLHWFVSLNVCTPAVAAGAWQPLPLALLTLNPAGDDFRLDIDLTAMPTPVDIELQTTRYTSRSFKGAQFGIHTMVGIREIERAMIGHENNTALQVMEHEVGHYLGLGSAELFDGSANGAHYNNIGVGPHCNDGPDTCVMRHDLTNPPNTHFCPICLEILCARDMSNPNVSTTVPFPA